MILAIDGALGPFSAAVRSADGTTERAAQTDGNTALERGLSAVAEVLGPRGFADIEAIAVTTGPGAFTGMRIALSYAKGLAFARRLPLIAMSSYDVVERDDVAPPSAVFVAGKRGFSHARLRFEAGGTVIRSGPDTEVAEFIAGTLPRGAYLTCFAAPQVALARLGERGLIVREHPNEDVSAALMLVRKALAREPVPDPHALRADYGAA